MWHEEQTGKQDHHDHQLEEMLPFQDGSYLIQNCSIPMKERPIANVGMTNNPA